MVKSKLYPTKIVYSENDPEYKKDRGFRSTTLYGVTLFGHALDVVLGSEKDKYKTEGVLHHVVYLYKDKKVQSKIGIWEILVSKKETSYDEDGDLILSHGKFIPFVNKTSLLSLLQDNPTEEVNNDELVDVEINNEPVDQPEYKQSGESKWINEYLQDNDYNIIDNEGCGDCFFAMVRDSLKGTDKERSVEEQRDMLAKHVDEALFNRYKELYEAFNGEILTKQEEMKQKAKDLSKLKSLSKKSTLTKAETQKLLEDAKKVSNEYKELENEKQKVEYIMTEFKFMEKITTTDQLRDHVKESDFWADEWAMDVIEQELNVKCIVMSQEMFEKEDYYSVLQCGHTSQREQKRPDYYILCGYTGIHYTLITYQKRTNFKFEDLPKKIKDLIVEKCIEKNAGDFAKNNDFKQYIKHLDLTNEIGSDDFDTTYDNDLYNSTDVLRFYIKSAEDDAGKADGDNIAKENNMMYSKLIKPKKTNDIYKHWRRKLDDKWERTSKEPLFTLDGRKWLTVSHYHEGSQFKKGYPDLYHQFSLDSNSELSKDVKLIKETLNTIDKKPDDDFNAVKNPRRIVERQKALYEKFNQNDDLKKVLMATNQAKLIQRVPGKNIQKNEALQKEIERGDISLMKLRQTLLLE